MRLKDPVIVHPPAFLNNAAGRDKDVRWDNPSNGVYNVYLADPKWTLIAVIPSGSSAAAPQHWIAPSLSASPPSVQINFLSPAGATGAFGGYVTVFYRK